MVINRALIVAQFKKEPRDLLKKIQSSLRSIEHSIKTPPAEDDSFLVVIEYWGIMPNKQSFKERAGFIVVDCNNSEGLLNLTESYFYV